MVKIKTIQLNSLNSEEHFQFMDYVDKLVTSYQATELGIQKVYLEFKEAFDEASKVADKRNARFEKIDSVYLKIVDMINLSILFGVSKPAVGSFILMLNEKIDAVKETATAR